MSPAISSFKETLSSKGSYVVAALPVGKSRQEEYRRKFVKGSLNIVALSTLLLQEKYCGKGNVLDS